MFEKGIQLRYYSKEKLLYISLEGVRYYISNHWTAQNKELFFNWLSAKAKQACQKKWSQNKFMPSNDSIESTKNPIIVMPQTSVAAPPRPPIREDSFQILINKMEELEKINRNLCYHILKLESRIESLEKKLDNLTAMLENVEDFLTKPEKFN